MCAALTRLTCPPPYGRRGLDFQISYNIGGTIPASSLSRLGSLSRLQVLCAPAP